MFFCNFTDSSKHFRRGYAGSPFERPVATVGPTLRVVAPPTPPPPPPPPPVIDLTVSTYDGSPYVHDPNHVRRDYNAENAWRAHEVRTDFNNRVYVFQSLPMGLWRQPSRPRSVHPYYLYNFIPLVRE